MSTSYYDDSAYSERGSQFSYEEYDDDSYYDDEDTLIGHKRKRINAKFKKFWEVISTKCSPVIRCAVYLLKVLERFFTSRPDEFIQLKNVLGFPFGAMLGLLIYHIVIEPMSLTLSLRQFLGGVMGLGMACGYALSVQVRCILILILPTFFGKTGRSYVAAYAVVFLVAGPIHNIIINGKEITRAMSCTSQLSANHTATKWELSLKPVGEVMNKFQQEGLYINKVIRRIDQAFSPLKKEITNEEESKKLKKKTKNVDRLTGAKRGNRLQKIEKRNKVEENADKAEKVESKYKKKLEYRCEDVWNHGVIKCRQKFHDLENKCRSSIPIIGYLLCLPFKLTFFCELVRIIPGAVGMDCDGMKVLDAGFGETYVASQDMVQSLESSFEVNLQYKIAKTSEEIDYTTAEEVRKGTMHQFDKKKIWLDFFMTLLQRFMAFTFILVFISAYKYNKRYLCDFRFDNIYITEYFRRIDARRKASGKKVLLPLKKTEASSVIFPTSTKLMTREKRKFIKGTFKLAMRALIATVIIMSSSLLYNVMDIIQRHSRIDYRQQGEHIIDIEVYGTGFMSEIVRLFLLGFNTENSVDQFTTNFGCLPRPVKLEKKYVVVIYMVFAAVWLLMLFESYGLRLRRVVASFFYRKREKKRILYLYNDMMKKRRGYLRHMRHHIREHIIDIEVYGTGFMSEIVRLFLLGFNTENSVDQFTTNFGCLPRPVKLEKKYVVVIYMVFAAVWLLMLFESYGLRLRRVVASFFYRKREKKRILYLYNDMMKKRRGYLRHMRHHIRKQARKQRLSKRISILVALRVQFPRLRPFLNLVASSKARCLICDDPETENYHRCETPGCNFGYCAECWFDLKYRCFACKPDKGDEEEWSELSDDDIISSAE